MSPHSPFPWMIADADNGDPLLVDADHRSICSFYGGSNHAANAPFVLRACSSHAALVKALQDANRILEHVLAITTTEQKWKLGELVDSDDLDGTGVTRRDARDAALKLAGTK